MTAFRKECLNHHIVSNNFETIEEYDRMVGIEIPDNLKQNLIKSPIVLLNRHCPQFCVNVNGIQL